MVKLTNERKKYIGNVLIVLSLAVVFGSHTQILLSATGLTRVNAVLHSRLNIVVGGVFNLIGLKLRKVF